MSLTKFGGKSKTIFLVGPEAHKLHQAFTVAENVTVKPGQPVKLNALGEITTLVGDGTDEHQRIGQCVQGGGEGDQVTVTMRGYQVVYATAKSALTPGAVLYVGQDSTDSDYGCYNDSGMTAANFTGWALDVADAEHDIIRVVLR